MIKYEWIKFILNVNVVLLIISFKKKNIKPIKTEKKRILKKFSFLLNLAEKLITTNERIIKKKGLRISDK